MPRHTVRVDATPAAVYALLADARRRPEWLPELVGTTAPSRPLEEGDRFEGYSALLGHRFVGASHVTEARPGQALAERVVIGARFTTRWTIAPGEAGAEARTDVTHTIDVEFPAGLFGRLERWVLSRRMAQLQRAGLRRLAAVVEGRA